VALIRTFVAIELTVAARMALEAIQDHLRIHLTLKFLGDVPEENLEAVYESVRRAFEGGPPFAVTLAGLGCFPNARRPRVIWVGAQEETGQLVALQSAIDHKLAGRGFPLERRAFHPHLTLARIRKKAERGEIEVLGRSVAAYDPGEVGKVWVDGVSVIKSVLGPQGATYTQLSKSLLVGEIKA
jgi:2'-5' RNA ligase